MLAKNIFKSLMLFLALSFTAMAAEVGTKAADFTLIDSHGKTHKLSDFKGKYVVLEWVNYGCPFVVKHYASHNMQMLQKQFTAQGVVWLAICSSAQGKEGNMTTEEINKKSAEYDAASTAYLIDADGKVGKEYGAKTTPQMFVIDPDGKIIYAGAIDDKPSKEQDDIKTAKNYVKDALNEALAGKAVTVKTSKPYGCSVKYAGK